MVEDLEPRDRFSGFHKELTCPYCGFQWMMFDPLRPLPPASTCPKCKKRFNTLQGLRT
jgi:DNA-directed RNA polymerase subunit RPC12/RpoP